MESQSKLFSVLSKAIQSLQSNQLDFCLVGGFAVSLRGEPRLTRDIDFAVATQSDAEAEAAIHLLQQDGFRVETILEQETAKRLATVRLLPPLYLDAEFLVDILFASCGIESEIVKEAEIIEILPGLCSKVAQRAHLIAMKVLSVDERTRPRDAEDLLNLLRLMTKPELDDVQRLIKLIDDRGFSRGRKLQNILCDFQARIV